MLGGLRACQTRGLPWLWDPRAMCSGRSACFYAIAKRKPSKNLSVLSMLRLVSQQTRRTLVNPEQAEQQRVC